MTRTNRFMKSGLVFLFLSMLLFVVYHFTTDAGNAYFVNFP